MTLHAFTMKTIDGELRPLSVYRGKVLLVVNTASHCGYTPQYAGLERVHRRIRDRGFSVLGFPSNDFGAQEPGTDAEIKTFCATMFDVSFPLFSKLQVKGPGKHPLYAFLSAAPPPGDVKWNFSKFLVDRGGNVAARFDASVPPEAPVILTAIEQALGG